MCFNLSDIDWLPPQSWHRIAWEFLRRNSIYIQQWQDNLSSKNSSQILSPNSELNSAASETLDSINMGHPWGLLWLADPALDCRTARVFWRSDISLSLVTISMVAKPSKPASLLTQLDMDMVRRESVQTGDGNYHYLFKGGFQDFQIILLNGSDTLADSDITFHFCADRPIDKQLLAVKSFLGFFSDGTIDLAGAHPSSTKLQRCRQLVALDASLAGASYRDIAVLLYGETTVSANWQSGHLKDRVRYAVREGRRLMNGGYRELLK
jgi:hypothetical protein